MAQFYASIQGNRGGATRMGTKSSGITGHIRGWDSGFKVVCEHDRDLGDVCYVYLTKGSNNSSGRLIASYSEATNKVIMHKAPQDAICEVIPCK